LKILSDICSSRCITGGNLWKKSSIRKVIIILFGHLWLVELTYRLIFSRKSTLRCKQSDIIPIGIVGTGGKFSAGIVGSGGKFATGISTIPVVPVAKFCRKYR
jgi:hypothetical protein